METLIDTNLTVFIFTCDAYSDLWDCTLSLFNQNFPTISSDKLFLVTDKKPSEKYGSFYKKFNIIWLESLLDNNYIEKLSFSLKHCSTKYFLYLLDDYFLTKKIEKKAVEDFLSFSLNYDVDYLKLNLKARKRLDKRVLKTKYANYYSLKTYMPYAVDLYPSIWKKDFAIRTCAKWPFKEKTIWDYEGKFNQLRNLISLDKCYINIKKSFPFVDGVRKGKVIRKSHKILKKQYGYDLTKNRSLMSIKEYYADKLFAFVSRHIPEKIKNRIKARNIKKGKKYYS